MLDRMRVKFPTAAIAILEFTGNWDQLAPRVGAADPVRDTPRPDSTGKAGRRYGMITPQARGTGLVSCAGNAMRLA